MNADNQIDDNIINQVRENLNWEKAAKKLLSLLWKIKGGYLFQTPVDIKKYNINDYYEIIKKPMDWGTIKTKLNTNVYSTCQEFLEDMELVFNNCLTYN